jgi:hypothetical protein
LTGNTRRATCSGCMSTAWVLACHVIAAKASKVVTCVTRPWWRIHFFTLSSSWGDTVKLELQIVVELSFVREDITSSISRNSRCGNSIAVVSACLVVCGRGWEPSGKCPLIRARAHPRRRETRSLRKRRRSNGSCRDPARNRHT